MPTMIQSQDRFLRISIADNVTDSTFYINKQQITLIDMPNEEVVRIYVGGAPFQYITITASDVSNPAGLIDAKQVRDYLLQICKQEFAETINAEDLATMMLEYKNLLTGIYQALSVYNPANVFNQPLIMDNSVAGTTYYGYAVAGTATNAAGWAIKKVVVSGGNTNILWTNGNLNLTNVWNSRTTYTYSSIAIQ